MHDYDALLKYFYTAGNQEREYLEKYWLDYRVWQSEWRPIQDSIFLPASRHLPDMMFQDDYKFIISTGGMVFNKDDFQIFQQCIQAADDRFFCIIENEYMRPVYTDEKGREFCLPVLRFKFPVDISWHELMNGGMISMEIFEILNKEFFVFGESSVWGRYIANEYIDTSIDPVGTPLDIIGFKKDYADIFSKRFMITEEEKQKISDWIPPAYKLRMRW